MSDEKEEKSKCGDFVVLGEANGDGSVSCLRHHPDHSMSIGKIIPMTDGQPIPEGGDIISLEREGDTPIHKVSTIWSSKEDGPKGPSMVNSRAFTDNWSRIFGKEPEVGEA